MYFAVQPKRPFKIPIPCVPDIFRKIDTSTVSDIIIKRVKLSIGNTSGFSHEMQYKQFVAERFNEDYFLVESTIEPRKNYATILSAWNKFRKDSGKDIKLVIVGNTGWSEDKLYEQISAYSFDGNWFLLNDVSSHELAGVYSNARATIIASYSEGFSYSGIKAMRCETPNIASGIQTHREVYGDNAIFFAPYTSADLVDALNQITTTSDRELDKMTQTAFQFSMQYSEEPSRLGWGNLFSRATQI